MSNDCFKTRHPTVRVRIFQKTGANGSIFLYQYDVRHLGKLGENDCGSPESTVRIGGGVKFPNEKQRNQCFRYELI